MWIACGNRYHTVAMGSFGKGKHPMGVCRVRGISPFVRDNKPKRGIACQRCLRIIERHEERKKKVASDELWIYGNGENSRRRRKIT